MRREDNADQQTAVLRSQAIDRPSVLRVLTLGFILLAVALLGIPYLASGLEGAHSGRFVQCKGPLSGRAFDIAEDTAGFGLVQGLPALKLGANEYVLTFDDGPDPSTTRQILDILRRNCVKATFMMVGKRARAHPDLVQAIVAEGHGIGSHSNTHGSVRRSAAIVEQDILDGVDNVNEAAYRKGRDPQMRQLFRIPGGNGVPPKPAADLLSFLVSEKLVVAGYDFSPADWKNNPPAETMSRFLSRKRSGGVIVLHDGPRNTPRFLLLLLAELRRRDATVVTMRLNSGTHLSTKD